MESQNFGLTLRMPMTGTREQILDAASRLIHIRGFNNTSIGDILRESGVGKGNFYYYFKSKEELGFSILDRSLERLREELLSSSFSPTKDPWRQLDDFLGTPVERVRRNGCTGGCPLGNLAVEMSDIHEGFRRRLELAFDELRFRIEASLMSAEAQGTLRPGTDVPRLARFILAGLEGAFLLGKLHKDPDVMAGVIEELKGHVAQHRVSETLPGRVRTEEPAAGR
jgi:TetR/AcrR family transcriptional repressor of nem operon